MRTCVTDKSTEALNTAESMPDERDWGTSARLHLVQKKAEMTVGT
jgi:hypothetical protein